MSVSRNDQRTQTICLLALTAVAGAAALYWLRPVMVPFVLALFVTMILSPLVEILRRHVHLARPLAVVVTLLLGIVAMVLVGGLVTSSLSELRDNTSVYSDRLEELKDKLVKALPLERFDLEEDAIARAIENSVDELRRAIVEASSALLAVFSQGLLVLIFVLFMLLGAHPPQGPPRGFLGEARERIRRYIASKVLLSAVTGVLVGSILHVLGVSMALAFGFFAFVLNFIPNVGSVVATLLPIPVVILSPDLSLVASICAIVLPGAIQFLVGNVVEPRMLGQSLDLHPVVILMALVFWGMLWGIMGMFLAIPITAVVKIVLERIEITVPIADLLAGRLDRLRGESGDAATDTWDPIESPVRKTE